MISVEKVRVMAMSSERYELRHCEATVDQLREHQVRLLQLSSGWLKIRMTTPLLLGRN